MISITCILQFENGSRITAEMQADSPDMLYPVKWKGEIERIPSAMLYEETQPAVLQAHCRQLAIKLGAKYEEQFDGEYESWAI